MHNWIVVDIILGRSDGGTVVNMYYDYTVWWIIENVEIGKYFFNIDLTSQCTTYIYGKL